MKKHVEQYSSITIHLKEIPIRNFYTISWTTCPYNKLITSSSSHAQSFISMTENENYVHSEMKQKEQCDLGQWHPCSASLFENDSRHGHGRGAHRSIQNAILGK